MNQIGTTVRSLGANVSMFPSATQPNVRDAVAGVIREDAQQRAARRSRRAHWRSFAFGFLAAVLLQVLYQVTTR